MFDQGDKYHILVCPGFDNERSKLKQCYRKKKVKSVKRSKGNDIPVPLYYKEVQQLQGNLLYKL